MSTGTLGANFSNRSGKLLVASVIRDGAAWNGDLSPNDEVVLINGVAPSDESVRSLVTSPVGTDMKLQVRRDGLIREVALKTLTSPDRKYQIQAVANPTAAQQRVLARWLGPTK